MNKIDWNHEGHMARIREKEVLYAEVVFEELINQFQYSLKDRETANLQFWLGFHDLKGE